MMYSWLLRRSTARGSSTGLVPGGPTKVKAAKSVLITEGTPEVEINIISQFSQIGEDCDQNGDRMSEKGLIKWSMPSLAAIEECIEK